MYYTLMLQYYIDNITFGSITFGRITFVVLYFVVLIQRLYIINILTN